MKCDILNPLEVTEHLEGCTAVLSALGHRGLQLSTITFYQDSMKSIVTAMRNAKIKRLICMTSFYSKCKYSICENRTVLFLMKIFDLDQPEKYPFMFRIIIRPMIGRHLDSMFIMEEFLENECKDLDYTIVRPPRLLDMHMIGKFDDCSIMSF